MGFDTKDLGGWEEVNVSGWGIIGGDEEDKGVCSLTIYFDSASEREEFVLGSGIDVTKRFGKKWRGNARKDINLFKSNT